MNISVLSDFPFLFFVRYPGSLAVQLRGAVDHVGDDFRAQARGHRAEQGRPAGAAAARGDPVAQGVPGGVAVLQFIESSSDVGRPGRPRQLF